MPGDAMLWLGCALTSGGVAILRLSWSRSGRSARLNTLAWGMLAGGSLLAGMAEGAWGVALAALFAMGTAALFLARAALEQPRSYRRAAAAPKAAAPIDRGDWRHGMVTFVLAGPAALAVAVVAALAARSLAIRWPVAEADANVMVLALVPLIWPLLAFAVLMIWDRRRQIAMLTAGFAAAPLPLLTLGGQP